MWVRLGIHGGYAYGYLPFVYVQMYGFRKRSNRESRTMTDRLVSKGALDSWEKKANQNIDEWGLQDRRTLLLAMQEELGELTQAVLENDSEGGDFQRQYEELDDLAALLFQLNNAIERKDREKANTKIEQFTEQ